MSQREKNGGMDMSKLYRKKHEEEQDGVMEIVADLLDRVYALKATIITASLHIERGYAGEALKVLEAGLRSEEE